MTSANLTRSETAQRSSAIAALTSTVVIDVSGAADIAVSGFPVEATMTFGATTAETWIDFIGEQVTRVQLNGVELPVEWDGARVRLPGLRANNTVVIDAVAAYSTSGEGMHRFVDPADGETYLYTQYEPADARRVMPCFEQPDLKFRTTFVVTAPVGWHVLSNQRITGIVSGDSAQTVTFAETLPLSSYITSIAAGPYHRVDSVWLHERQDVELGVLCRRSLAQYLDADEIVDVTKLGLDFFTQAFGYDYPWGKYDQIFVPEYNLGAMENPGLVTFTEQYLYRGASTAAQHEGRANTILHEMAHMWFGDLVTMKWWDDLWLKESFADYMGAHASVAATTFTDAWVTFANRRKAWAYQQDQLPTTHPIVADITDLEAAKLNFDGITYAKGAAVLKQLVAYVGEDAFFAAARAYFREHAFGNTTLADFLAVLERASGRDMSAWSAAWLETTGVTTIAAERRGNTLVITQDEPRPHTLAVGFWAREGNRLLRRGLVEVTISDEVTAIELPVLASADLILPNDTDLTYAKVRLDDVSRESAVAHLSAVDGQLTRALLWSALWNETRDGVLSATLFLDVVSRHGVAEPSPTLLTAALANAATAIERYVAPESRSAAQAAWLETTWTALRSAEAGSDSQVLWAWAFGRAAAGCSDRSNEIRAMLDGTLAPPGGLQLDADLRWLWLTALIATGAADPAVADAELQRDATASGAVAHREAVAAAPSREQRIAGWDQAFTDRTLSNDHLGALIAGVTAGDGSLIRDRDAAYFSALARVWRERSIEIARRIVTGLFPQTETTELADAWLEGHRDAPHALRRLVIEGRDNLRRAHVAQREDAAHG